MLAAPSVETEPARQIYVYTGPSLPGPEAEAGLPGCAVRGPIQRGDLYRDRSDGGTVFLIIDGVFHQSLAVPPREILDVIADGGLVVGCSSMGALRAAECWPAGMIGVGAIYRLYRRGILKSDDEVALIFNAHDGFRPFSEPLINVRHALSRAVREGCLDRLTGERIARVAAGLFYAERTWPRILDQAGVDDGCGTLETFLSAFDLKRMDARRAVSNVSRRLCRFPGIAERPRKASGPFKPNEQVRELPADPLAGSDPQDLKRRLARWHLVSGRAFRYLPAIVAGEPEALYARLAANDRQAVSLARILADLTVPALADAVPEQVAVQAARSKLALFAAWCAFTGDEDAFADKLWAELMVRGELEAAVFRWRAVTQAAEAGRSGGLEVRAIDRELATGEIVIEHGLASWPHLRQVSRHGAYAWDLFTACRDDLAIAKRVRADLFRSGAAPASLGSPAMC